MSEILFGQTSRQACAAVLLLTCLLAPLRGQEQPQRVLVDFLGRLHVGTDLKMEPDHIGPQLVHPPKILLNARPVVYPVLFDDPAEHARLVARAHSSCPEPIDVSSALSRTVESASRKRPMAIPASQKISAASPSAPNPSSAEGTSAP